jgi:penicillin amidase
MFKKIVRVLLIFLLVLLLAGVTAALLAPEITQMVAQQSFPQIDGEIQLEGLDHPVDIYRDSFGVPHIYAVSERDLMFAQGYVHAQDRFWQMDFWRHQGSGRLSELLGASTLEEDLFLRTLGWERIAEEEFALMDPSKQAIFEAYAAGVNAYLADHQGSVISLEYAFLPLINPDYVPPPWTPINTLTWGKAMAWELGNGQLNREITYSMLLHDLPQDTIDFLLPAYPSDHPVIVPNPHLTLDAAVDPSSNQGALLRAVYPALQDTKELMIASGAHFLDGIGSNNWVISGELTKSGMPMLANDMHLAAQMPSIWYENGLHCAPVSPECSYEAVGFSFAGVPGIVVGHNANLAWGFTNVGPDVVDLYIEKINPQNPNQYEYQGEWLDMEIVSDLIHIAGGDPVELTTRITRHGPLITDVYGLEDFHTTAGVELPQNYAISLRWTALEPTCLMCAIWGFDTAQNWDEFRAASKQFSAPSQNIVYADRDGNIGYQMPGNIPIRSEGHSGQFPVPGWTGEYEWQGYIPFDELPYAFNPPEGYVATANNAVVGPAYPYMISQQFAYGFRARRIVDLIESSSDLMDATYIQKMHADNMDLLAEELIPVLMDTPLVNPELREMSGLFQGWNYQMDMDSAPAALYAVFWKHLLSLTFDDQLPEYFWPNGSTLWMQVTRQILYDPANPWWDDQSTTEIETRDDIFERSFEAALDELRKISGKDPSKWAWGDLHTLIFTNQVMDSFPLINKAFNRGPYRTAGGSAVINATNWSTQEGFEVPSLPSERVIMDLSNWQDSQSIHPTGQSGHAYHPHYVDMADPWRLIEYHPQHWERGAIQADAEGHLKLLP